MKGRIIADWSKIDFTNPEHLKKLSGAFQYFMKAPERNRTLKAAIQQFATKGDFPAEVLQILEKFHATPDYDLGYEQIFDIRDFTGTKESGFEILDVSSGLAFKKVKTGEKAKVYKFSGSKTTVSFDRYGGGLGWDKTLIDDGKYWTLEDSAIAFRNKAYSSKAQAFYDLIDALPDSKNLAWQGSSGDATVDRDIATINKACEQILLALKDSGLGVNANSRFIVLTPIQLKARINRALTKLNQAYVGASKGITYAVDPLYTLMLSSGTKYYVILPKRKLKGGNRMDLTLFNMFNILEYTETVVGWMRYGGAIGETDQLRRCATS